MRSLLWIVLVGVLARAAIIACHPAPGGLKRLEPSVIADRLNAGQGFTFEQYGTTYKAWKEPLYIWLLARVTRWTGEGELALVLFQGLFGIGAALGVAWIARGLFGDSGRAVLAGMIAAASPFLVYYDTHVIHPLSLDALLFTLTAGSILSAVSGAGGLRQAVWAGLIMGLAWWQKAALLASGLLSWVAAVAQAPRRHRPSMTGRTVVWLGVSLLVIAPWLIRNYRLFGRLVVTTDAAHVLWLGNNPWSNGTYSDMAGRRVIAYADPAFQARLHGAPEIEQHDLFLSDARRFIREHPWRFGSLVLRRLWAFVWFSPNAGVEYTASEGALYRIAYLGLLSFGLIGLMLFWRRARREERRRAIVLLSAVAGLAVVHAVTAINLKHRVPFELILAIFASESLSASLAAVHMRMAHRLQLQ